MKKQKIIALSAIACFVCAGAGIFALSGSADTNVSEKNIRYEYALLGEIYTPEDGLISAKSPEGTAINSERDFRKTQQKTPNNIENSLQMIA